tara:strand:+ start:501 stop:818 length:318 start_codon:yes stop_codon:yes gene_type:complete
MNKDKTIEKGAAFTPGPWIAMGKAVYTESDNPTREILWGGHNTRSASNEEKQANARLIAQAPAMYEQCKLFERVLVELQIQGETGVDEQLTKLREMLAKVDGGEG